MFLCCRPLVQQKLDVLGKAGLSKDNFSNADTKYLKVGGTGVVYFVGDGIDVFCMVNSGI